MKNYKNRTKIRKVYMFARRNKTENKQTNNNEKEMEWKTKRKRGWRESKNKNIVQIRKVLSEYD